MYRDGATVGLYLQVTGAEAKSWLYRYMLNGKARAMGLGSAMQGQVSLAEARQMAQDARKRAGAGIDPLEARDAATEAARLEAARSISFRQAAERYIEAHKGGWTNAKHVYQWETTLKMFAYPLIGDVSTSAVATEHVMQVLEPIWNSKRETASRLRGRIEKILDWARVSGYRKGENPARWRDHLRHLLSNQKKPVRHYPSLPYAQMAQFYAVLRQETGVSASALEFTVLTAARTSEVTGMRFGEIDWADKIWTVPGERMKAKRPHRVPLCERAVAILERMKTDKISDYVFSGATKRSKRLTEPQRRHPSRFPTWRWRFLSIAWVIGKTIRGNRSQFMDSVPRFVIGLHMRPASRVRLPRCHWLTSSPMRPSRPISEAIC